MPEESQSSSPAAQAPSSKPIVAILTIDDEQQAFRGNRSNFADLIRTGEQMGFTTYVMTVKHYTFKSPKVLGYTLRAEDGTWVQSWFPRPGIVYNRIPLREDEQLPYVRSMLRRLARQPGVRLFNRRFFNKWSLHRWLRSHPATRVHVPETRRLTSILVLARMLKRHKLLYLKPVRGKAGVGIMTVRTEPEEALPYLLQIQEEAGSRVYRCATMRRLWERILAFADTVSENYIAQQGILLTAMDSRPFDLRALAQKNITGRWELTGLGARVAGKTSITTHVPRGGSIDDPDKLLSAVFGKEQARQVLVKVRSTILILARQIERASKSRLAEMSMDIGVDRKGHVWFFEANAKPMKFDEPHIRSKSLQRIFQYSLYLHRRDARKTGR